MTTYSLVTVYPVVGYYSYSYCDQCYQQRAHTDIVHMTTCSLVTVYSV